MKRTFVAIRESNNDTVHTSIPIEYQVIDESSINNMTKPDPDLKASLIALTTTNIFFNVLILIFFPLGLLSNHLAWGDLSTFILSMLSIIGLAKMLDLSTEQLSRRTGQALGALVNASFGNAVEVIVSVMALREGLTVVVRSSLLGSVLSNLLFVLGFCFFIGGIQYKEQKFSSAAANINSSLLALSMIGFLLPAALNLATPDLVSQHHKQVLFSRGISICLLIIYIAFMYFQLSTHPHFFAVEEEEEEELMVSIPVSITTLITSTILIGISAESLVSSISGLSSSYGISETFIGLIIIPIVGNAAEHVTAVFAAARNKMDLAIGVALGSSLQISIFVTPLLVIIGWMINVELTLDFPIFDVSVVFISILVVISLVNDGRSNWLEGFMLLMSYLIIAFGFALI